MAQRADEQLTTKVERILGRRPGLSEKDRERLMARILALIDERVGIENDWRKPLRPPNPEQGSEYILWKRSFELLHEAADIAAELLGKTVLELALPDDGDDPKGVRSALSRRLRLTRPLFSKPPKWSRTFARLLDELERLNGGDEPEIFAPEPRVPGQSPRPVLIARMRLRALAWNEHLQQLGLSAAERHRAISEAYGSDWEAIRKWRVACQTIFGPAAVLGELRHGRTMFWGDYEKDWLVALRRDGERYRHTWKEERAGKT